jgi:hypothetical protein
VKFEVIEGGKDNGVKEPPWLDKFGKGSVLLVKTKDNNFLVDQIEIVDRTPECTLIRVNTQGITWVYTRYYCSTYYLLSIIKDNKLLEEDNLGNNLSNTIESNLRYTLDEKGDITVHEF